MYDGLVAACLSLQSDLKGDAKKNKLSIINSPLNKCDAQKRHAETHPIKVEGNRLDNLTFITLFDFDKVLFI